MEINDLHIWLRSDRNFTRGMELLQHFAPGDILLRIAKTESSFYRDQLVKKIQQLCLQHPEIKPVTKAVKEKPVVTRVTDFIPAAASQKKDYVEIDKLPEPLRQKFFENGDLARQANYLKSQLHNFSGSELTEACAAIREYQLRNIENWKEIDHFIHHKKEMVKEVKEDKRLLQRIPQNELYRRLLSLRSQRSKAKAKKDALKVKDLSIKIKQLEIDIENYDKG